MILTKAEKNVTVEKFYEQLLIHQFLVRDMTILTIILRYKMRGDPVKNQRKKPQRNLSCKETQKHGT